MEYIYVVMYKQYSGARLFALNSIVGEKLRRAVKLYKWYLEL